MYIYIYAHLLSGCRTNVTELGDGETQGTCDIGHACQPDGTEEEVSREKAQRRKIQRELEDLIQDNVAKDREITNLKNKLRRGIVPSSLQLSKPGRAGSIAPSEVGQDSLQDKSSLDGEENSEK